MASNTSGRRRTGTRKKTSSASRRTAGKKQRDNAFIRDEIQVLLLFAFSVLLLISNFGFGGAAGGFVSGVMFGLFGIFAYILPVGMFLVAAFSISNRENTIALVKGAAMVAAGFLLCGILQMFGGEKGGEETVAAFYAFSAEHKTGGGVFGGMLCKILKGAFGTAGAWIVLLALLIICAVVITERSFISGVKTGGKRVYDTAREDARRHRLLAEERRTARQKAVAEQAAAGQEEQEKKSRIERKVSGVALEETTIRKDAYTDEMREITFSAEPDLKDLDEMFEIPVHRERPEEENVPEEAAAVREEPPSEEALEEEAEASESVPVRKSRTRNPGPQASRQPEPVRESVSREPVLQHAFPASEQNPPRTYTPPPISLLKQVKNTAGKDIDRKLQETAMHLQQILRDFGVSVTVTDVSRGPSVTRYEIQPDQGVNHYVDKAGLELRDLPASAS